MNGIDGVMIFKVIWIVMESVMYVNKILNHNDFEPLSTKAGGFFMCAWHDAVASLPGTKLEVKRSPLPDGRATPTRQGHQPEMVGLKEA